MTRKANIENLRKLFSQGENLLKALREGADANSQEAIMLSYDLQAGSYTQQVTDSESVRANKITYGRILADILRSLGSKTILDAGTGEATSLFFLLKELELEIDVDVLAFDISLSRLLFAKKFLSSSTFQRISLFAAALDNIPIKTSSVDTVITNHALEPNGGRERDLIKELMRVAGRYLVLVEPSWELGNDATRARIDEHRYVKGLPEILVSMGAIIRRHELWRNNINPSNEAALIIAEVPGSSEWRQQPATFRSPIGFGALEDRGSYFYSPSDGFLFTKIEGVACLLEDHGILAARLDEAIG